ncbi:MAG: hypothetical protein P1U39_00660 [Legionellaceae bacterium]|nr:hypothetical protein [Legionellaceae bacterium]
MSLVSLQKVLEYSNQKVVERYEKDYPKNQLRGERALEEILKFLWLSQKHAFDLKCNPTDPRFQFKFYMYPEMVEIDHMWHTFILFTQDYVSFGETFFGEYLHHFPSMKDGEHTFDSFIDEQVNRHLSYIYDHLGADTVRLWFAKFL